MNTLAIASIILLLTAIILFTIGLYGFWAIIPAPYWGVVLVMIGVLFMLGSIIMLSVATDY